MENSELLILALKKIGVYNIPVELLKYDLDNVDTVNEIIAVILEGKVQTYPGLICFLEKKHNGKNVSVVQIPKNITGGQSHNTNNPQNTPKNLNSNFQELSNELKAYFDNLVQDASNKLSKANKVFERRKTREEISKKVNDRINEMFSQLDSNPKDEKSINSVFQNISEGINNAFNTVSQEFNNAINQSEEEKTTSFDSVMKDISNKVNNTVSSINAKINENKNNIKDVNSAKQTIDSIADDITEKAKQFDDKSSNKTGYSEYYRSDSHNKSTDFNKKANDFAKGVEENITDAFGKIGSILENGIDEKKVSDTFSDVGNAIGGFFDSIFGTGNSKSNTTSKSQNTTASVQKPINNPVQSSNVNTASKDNTNNCDIDIESMFNIKPKQLSDSSYNTLTTNIANVTAVRTIGKKHIQSGVGCDDWVEIANIGDCTVIAVADGVGSKNFSGIGAKEACLSAIEFVKGDVQTIISNSNFINDIKKPLNKIEFQTACRALAIMVQNAVIEACSGVEKACKERQDSLQYTNVSIEDFACTFILTVILPIRIDNTTEHLIISCQIGDGAVVTVNENGNFDNALGILGDVTLEKNYLMDTKEKQYGSFMRNIKATRRNISKILVMTNGVSDDYAKVNNEMLALLLDLQINGVFDTNIVNSDKDIVYIKKLMDENNISLEKLWLDRDSLHGNNLKGNTTAEKLMSWLKNYKSNTTLLSDDRTMVIYDTNKSID